MDIEKLTKSQIVLLTLFVSFVTSIATGIVAVSLMEQAPPAVAQTVNRIIERTVEKVTPSSQTASTVMQEKTVVVKESDLISKAIERVGPSIVRIESSGDENPEFLGLGVILNASGTIAVDSSMLGDLASPVLARPDGTHVRASVTLRDPDSGVAYLAPASTTPDGGRPVWNPAVIAREQSALGETVVVIAGRAAIRIASGIVTALLPPKSDSGVLVIDTDVASASILPGSPLINTDGALIGISTAVARDASASGFVSGESLMKALHVPAPK